MPDDRPTRDNMSPPTLQPSQNVLLTGAGFTKPFRGYLASEMWALILNEPEIHTYSHLRNCLLENRNFEVAYDHVLLSNDYGKEEKKAFINALRRAYQHLHSSTCGEFQLHANQLCRLVVAKFGQVKQGELGFIFTLNQDLFLERHFSDDYCSISIPGLRRDDWFHPKYDQPFAIEPSVDLPKSDKVKELKLQFWSGKGGRLVYLKLHGSVGWRAADGSELLIVGTTKSAAIEKEPLLHWYSDLFKEVLHAGERNLLVIGYGFKDPHINTVIADGIKKYKLRLYIVTPQSPDEFYDQLVPRHAVVTRPIDHRGQEIWDGLAGYYVRSVDQLISNEWNLLPDGEVLLDRLKLR
jgi:SIR2-like protein